MATIPQRLIATAEAAMKAGSKSGRETEAYFRKHEPQLAREHISHVYMAHKMVRKPQFAPAIAAIKKGAAGTLAAIAKPYQSARVPRGSSERSNDIDARFAKALSLDDAPPPKRKRRAEPAPTVAAAVFEQALSTIKAGARKAGRKE